MSNPPSPTSQVPFPQPSSLGTLRPAVWNQDDFDSSEFVDVPESPAVDDFNPTAAPSSTPTRQRVDQSQTASTTLPVQPGSPATLRAAIPPSLPPRPSAFMTSPKLHWTVAKGIETVQYTKLYNLPHKLGQVEYICWMTSIQSALETERLFEYCRGSVPIPSDPTHLERFRCARNLVRTILVFNMAPDTVPRFSLMKTPDEIWKEAARLYSAQTSADFTRLITSLITTKYVEGEDIKAHLAKMNGFLRDIFIMGRDLPDDVYATFLRLSLPPSWNFVFAGLPDPYTSAQVEQKILEHDGILSHQQTSVTHTAFMAASPSRRHRSSSSSSLSSIRGSNPDEFCTNCKVPGHTKAKCFSRGGDRWKNNHKKFQKPKEKANLARDAFEAGAQSSPSIVEENLEVDSTYYVVPKPETWIIDGGAPHHFCNNLSLFHSYTPVSPQPNFSGLDPHSSSKCVGIGSIKLRFPMLSTRSHTITLTNVLYCPEATANLISEGQLDDKGLHVNKSNGVVKVLKSNGDLRMVGCRKGSHYHLTCHALQP